MQRSGLINKVELARGGSVNNGATQPNLYIYIFFSMIKEKRFILHTILELGGPGVALASLHL